jgi:catechol 2,3-dioxygenase-like lactoylglutathione lyase family enzyme
MLRRLSHVTIYVNDQEAAKTFYTDKLGFEVRTDETMDGFPWLTVGPKDQPELELILIEPNPPMCDPETAGVLREIIAKGTLGTGVFRTDDCRGTVEELKAQGVTVLQEPAERPYGIEATFRDDSGNWYSLTEPAS